MLYLPLTINPTPCSVFLYVGTLTYCICGTFGGDFNLVVILIWWFGDFGFDCQIKCTPPLLMITCIMKHHEAIYT